MSKSGNIGIFLEKFKTIQETFLDYLDGDENNEANFGKLNQLLEDAKIQDNKQDFRLFLHFILKVANNHHRCPNFYSKIDRILQDFSDDLRNIDVNVISECDIYYKELKSFFEVRQAICIDEKSALNMAIDNGSFEIALLLLEYPGIFPNVTSYYRKDEQYKTEYTPLQRAVELGNYDIVKLLLSKPDVDVNIITSYKYGYRNQIPFAENQRTALHIAIEQKNHAILKLLLQRNEIDVNAKYISKHYANMRTYRSGEFKLTRAKRKDYNNYECYELYKIHYNDEMDKNQIEKFESTVNDTIKKIESLFDDFDREIIYN